MAWIGARLLGRKNGDETEDTPAAPPGPVIVDDRPAIMLLVPDASGRASYQSHPFRDVTELEDFVAFWFGSNVDGLIAFWAMTAEPAPHDSWPQAETVVLIRSEEQPDVVYLFSFHNMGAGLEFVREEVHWRLDLSKVSVYWAVPVKIHAFAPRASITAKITVEPTLPPPVIQPEPAGRAAVRPEDAHEPVAGDDVPVAEMPGIAPREAPAKLPFTTPSPVSLPNVHRVRNTGDGVPRAASKNGKSRRQTRRSATSESPAQHRHSVEPAPAAAEAPLGALEIIIEPKEEKKLPSPTAKEAVEFNAAPSARDGTPAYPDSADLAKQVQKVLNTRRWEKREGPFEGFGSPPGKF